MPDRCPVIAVVGAGFCGTATAIHLLRSATPGTRILLIERGDRTGRGIAYGTGDARHRLNVAAARMSLFPDAPGDFAAWAGCADEAFMPRCRYGDYLVERLAAAAAGSPARLERLHGEVVGARDRGGALELRLASGGTLACDRAVLALGWLPPSAPWPGDERVITDPWAPGALGRAAREGTTLIVGTGPTAVDVALTVAAAPGTRVVAVSRRGLLPFAHLPGLRTPAPPPDFGLGPLRMRVAEATVRAHIARRAREGYDWRDVIDGLRPLVPALWARIPDTDRRRFLASRVRAWEIRRHRLAPEVAGEVATLRAAGRLEIRAGGLEGIRTDGRRVELQLRDGAVLRGDRVVLCAGAGGTVEGTTNALVADSWPAGSRCRTRSAWACGRRPAARCSIGAAWRAGGCGRSGRCGAASCGRAPQCPSCGCRPQRRRPRRSPQLSARRRSRSEPVSSRPPPRGHARARPPARGRRRTPAPSAARRCAARRGHGLVEHDPPGALAHDQHARPEERGLLDAVRDEERGPARLAPDPVQLGLHLLARQRVERAERLVEQHDLRLGREHPRDLAALLHAARELVGARVGEVGKADARELGVGRRVPLPLRDATHAEAEGDVVADAEPRVEVRVLEDDPAVRARSAHGPAVDGDGARGGRLEAGEQREERRLAAARRADDRDEFAGPDLDVERAERLDLGPAPATVDVADAVEEDAHRAAAASANPALTASE